MIVTNLQAMQTPWGQNLNYDLTYVIRKKCSYQYT